MEPGIVAAADLPGKGTILRRLFTDLFRRWTRGLEIQGIPQFGLRAPHGDLTKH